MIVIDLLFYYLDHHVVVLHLSCQISCIILWQEHVQCNPIKIDNHTLLINVQLVQNDLGPTSFFLKKQTFDLK